MSKLFAMTMSAALVSAVSANAIPLSGDELTISSSATTPLISLDNIGTVGDSSILLDHDPTALDPASAHFYFNTATFPTANEPASSRADTVWTFGYNVNPGGGRVDPTEPTLALHFENYYIQGGAIGQPEAVEFHLESVDTSGGVHRPISAYLNRDGSDAQISYAANIHRFYDYNEVQRVNFDFTNPAASSIFFDKPTTMYFGANNYINEIQLNATGTAWLNLPYIDSTNGLMISEKVNTPSGTLRVIGGLNSDTLCIEGHPVSCIAKGDGGGGIVGGQNATYVSGTGVTRTQADPIAATYWRGVDGTVRIFAGPTAAIGTVVTEIAQFNATGLAIGCVGAGAGAPVDICGNTIRLRAAKTFGVTCNVGDIGWDATPRIGICVATNTWRFSALTP